MGQLSTKNVNNPIFNLRRYLVWYFSWICNKVFLLTPPTSSKDYYGKQCLSLICNSNLIVLWQVWVHWITKYKEGGGKGYQQTNWLIFTAIAQRATAVIKAKCCVSLKEEAATLHLVVIKRSTGNDIVAVISVITFPPFLPFPSSTFHIEEGFEYKSWSEWKWILSFPPKPFHKKRTLNTWLTCKKIELDQQKRL